MSNEDWSDREIDDGGPGERAVDREIERLKSIYQHHADALAKLAGSAPTRALAKKYDELIGEINRSILGLEDPGAIALRRTHDRPLETALPPEARPPARTSPPTRSPSDVRLRTEPGTLASDAGSDQSALGRILLILVMAIVVIGVLAFFVWKYGSQPRTEPSPSETVTVQDPGSTLAVSAPDLAISPEALDYGVVYKGTRVAKTFQVTNTTDREMTIEVERSKCRCLWFDYPKILPPGGSIELVVAVDGALAEPGLLSEGVVVSSKQPPRQSAEALVTAEIR